MALTEEDRAEIEAIVDAKLKARSDAYKARKGGASGGGKPQGAQGEIVGKCPLCKDGQVKSGVTRNGKTYYACSNRNYKDSSTCQFVHWDDLASLKEKLGEPAVEAEPVKEEKPKKAKGEVVAIDRMRTVTAVVGKLNHMDADEREQLISSLDLPEGNTIFARLTHADDEKLKVLCELLGVE